MSRAEKISRMKAEQARDRYYSRQIERQETADTADRPAVYRGYDANSGSHITQRTGHNPVPGAISLTNGGLSEGEAIVQTGGSNSFAAMPHPRRRRRRRRQILTTETLISVLFVGAKERSIKGYGKEANYETFRTLVIWIANGNGSEVKRIEIELNFLNVTAIADGTGATIKRITIDPSIKTTTPIHDVFDLQGYCYFVGTDESIVQLYDPYLLAANTRGDLTAVTTITQQPGIVQGVNSFGYDLMTIHLQSGVIIKIELTTVSTDASDGNLVYSDYWEVYLPYLYRSGKFNADLLDDRLTIAPAGRFTLEQPPKPEQGRDGFKDLKNFFGDEPPAYALSDGDPATFALSVDDFGFSEAEKAFATQDGVPFADRLKIEQSDRLSAPFGGFQVNASYVHIRCAAVRGFVE